MKKKTNRILTVLIILLVIVLGAAAGVGIYSFKYEKSENTTDEAAVAKDDDTEKELKKEEAKKDSENKERIKEESKSREEEEEDEAEEAEKAEQASSSETARSGSGHIVCIDPGHQTNGDSSTEPNGPGSSTMKARVTGGTHGDTSGLAEYQLTMIVSEKLKQELESRGYTVYMTRESNDVSISNAERAQYATSVGADIYVRIHANGSESTSTNGALALVPSSSNPYVSNLASSSYTLGQCILDAYCASCGMANLGVQTNDTMTGINWATMPVMILEMGFMTNPTDDANMADETYQISMVNGMADGIDSYFGE